MSMFIPFWNNATKIRKNFDFCKFGGEKSAKRGEESENFNENVGKRTRPLRYS